MNDLNKKVSDLVHVGAQSISRSRRSLEAHSEAQVMALEKALFTRDVEIRLTYKNLAECAASFKTLLDVLRNNDIDYAYLTAGSIEFANGSAIVFLVEGEKSKT